MWPNPQFPADLATFTEEILNQKVHFLYSFFFTVSYFPAFYVNTEVYRSKQSYKSHENMEVFFFLTK